MINSVIMIFLKFRHSYHIRELTDAERAVKVKLQWHFNWRASIIAELRLAIPGL